MRFDDAIKHFESMVVDSINNKQVFLEPKNLKIRRCSDPSIHINHKNHFTTHHLIYDKNNIYMYQPGWGDANVLISKIMGT